VNKSFYNIGVLNANVKFSGKLSKFKLDATTSADFSVGLYHQRCKSISFCQNNSQCWLTEGIIRLKMHALH